MLDAVRLLFPLLLCVACAPRVEPPSPDPARSPSPAAPTSPPRAPPPRATPSPDSAPITPPSQTTPSLDAAFAGPSPDVLVVVLDTTGPQGVTAAMPNAASFARSARHYPRAVAPSNSTMETVAGVFTGVPMSNARLWEPGLTPIAQSLKERGYSTYIASANPVLAHPFYERGFDQSHLRLEEKTRDFPDRGEVEHFEATWPTLPRPRFAWVQLVACHDYRVAGLDFESTGPARGPEELEAAWQAYLLDCAATDALLPRLLEANPAGITVLTADHGELFGHRGSYPLPGQAEHGHGIGSAPMEIEVPLAIRGPGFAPGRDERPVSLLDLHSTLLAAAGMTADGGDLRSDGPLRPRLAANCYLDDEPDQEFTALLLDDESQLIRSSGRPGVPELIRWTPSGAGLKADWSAVDPSTLGADQRRALYETGRLLCVSDEDLCRKHPGLGSLGYIDCPG